MRASNLLRPVYLVRRVACWIHQKRHPNEPWLAPGAVRFLDSKLRSEHVGFEWGSGRSTAWFAARLKHLTSIEHDESWCQTVAAQLREKKITNADLRHISLEHPYAELFSPYYDPLPAYVRAIDEFPDSHFDFILVDGYYRQPCALRALQKIKPGGLFVIDNTNWMPREQWPVPLQWPLLHQSSNVQTQTSVWQRPSDSQPLAAPEQ